MQLSELEKEFSDLEEIWKSEKAAMQGAAHIKEELERARLELETANRAHDLTRMSELQYGKIPELERQLADALQAETRDNILLRNNVTDEEVAEIVSKWTGIPVSKMLEGEKGKLLQDVIAGSGHRCSGDPVSPLYQRPATAGQSDRPHRRGGLTHSHRDRFQTGGNGQAGAPNYSAEDRARSTEQGIR